MAEEQSQTDKVEQPQGPLGYEDLSMNVVPASATEERSEAGRRAGGLGLLVVVVAAAALIAVVGARLVRNAPPGAEAEERLRTRLRSLAEWQSGVVMEARYVAGDRVRVDFSPRLSPMKEEERELIRQTTRDVMLVLAEERPNRDLYADGYQGERKMVRAELRHKTTLLGPEGQQVPEIIVRVAGDPEEGLGQAYGRSGKPTVSR